MMDENERAEVDGRRKTWVISKGISYIRLLGAQTGPVFGVTEFYDALLNLSSSLCSLSGTRVVRWLLSGRLISASD